MGSDLQGRVWRESDLDTLPDEPWKYEIVSGNLLREPLPMPRHARIAARIAALLDVWARRERTGVVCAGDLGFVLARDPDTVRGPDVAFVSRDRWDASDETRRFSGAPDLAVEVLSPGNSAKEMRRKVADYLSAGARAVWIFDPEASAVEVHRPESPPRRLERGDVLTGGESFPGLRIPIDDVFDPY